MKSCIFVNHCLRCGPNLRQYNTKQNPVCLWGHINELCILDLILPPLLFCLPQPFGIL